MKRVFPRSIIVPPDALANELFHTPTIGTPKAHRGESHDFGFHLAKTAGCSQDSPRSASTPNTQPNTSRCVSKSINRRVREIVE